MQISASIAQTPPVDASGGQADGPPRIIWPLVFIAALLFFPAAVRYLLGTSSNTAGLLVGCLVVWGAALLSGGFEKGSFARRALVFSLIAVIILSVHLGIAAYLPLIPQSIDIARTGGSLVAVILTIVAAGIVADWLKKAAPADIDRITAILRVLMVLIGLWCFVGYQPPSPLSLPRASFPFTEPSHYALVAAPLLLDGCIRASLPRRIVWLLIWLGIGFINQSLSLMVAVTIAAAVSLPILYLAIASVSALAVITQIDLKYYTDRLDFTSDSSNLSALIYRQGWELIQQGMDYSRGWGVGFQQLGFTPLNVPTSDLIYKLLGDDSNLRDGSFLASKFISELGVFGCIVVILFSYLALRSGLFLRNVTAIPQELQRSNIRIAAAMLCSFTTELFVRGIGYFSGTVIFALASAMILMGHRQQDGR